MRSTRPSSREELRSLAPHKSRPIDPEFSKFCIDPHPGDISRASLSIETVKGQIEVSYKVEGKKITVEFTVPAGYTCETYLGGTRIWTEGRHALSGVPACCLTPRLKNGTPANPWV